MRQPAGPRRLVAATIRLLARLASTLTGLLGLTRLAGPGANVTAAGLDGAPWERVLDLAERRARSPAPRKAPVAVGLLYPDGLFDCARPVLRDSPGFLRVMHAVRVHAAASLAARHPRSYPARVAVTLSGGQVAGFLSDGRSPAPGWSWDAVLGKAQAVAVRAGTEDAVARLREVTSRSANAVELLTFAMSLVRDHDPASRGDRW